MLAPMTATALPSRQWQPRQWAQALTRLPPECRALGLRHVPRAWRGLVRYLVWVYVPGLRRLAAARPAVGGGSHA